jgi:IrrE N-terminal-like domain
MVELESPFAAIARHQVTPPVNVEHLAEVLCLPVTRRDLGPSVSAMIQRDPTRRGSSGFVIYINSKDPMVRQRFSLAHEIAHFILHRDLIDQGVTDDTMYRSSELSSVYETQANQLAADILMPIRLVKKSFQANSSLAQLAILFQVSKGAMKIRLDGMGLNYLP